MDVWINFTNASKWQAKGIFKCFFPYKPKPAEPSADEDDKSKEPSSGYDALRSPGQKTNPNLNIPSLSEEELDELAERFSQAIPEDEFSVGLYVLLFPSIF